MKAFEEQKRRKAQVNKMKGAEDEAELAVSEPSPQKLLFFSLVTATSIALWMHVFIPLVS